MTCSSEFYVSTNFIPMVHVSFMKLQLANSAEGWFVSDYGNKEQTFEDRPKFGVTGIFS